MAKFRKGEKMKDNIGKALICLVLLLICGVMAALFGMLVADFVQAVKNKPEQPQTYNDVTFEVIDTYDSAGNNLIYNTSTGIERVLFTRAVTVCTSLTIPRTVIFTYTVITNCKR